MLRPWGQTALYAKNFFTLTLYTAIKKVQAIFGRPTALESKQKGHLYVLYTDSEEHDVIYVSMLSCHAVLPLPRIDR